jgi:hypothetical protein
MTTPPSVILCELLVEVDEIASAARDGLIAAVEQPPNMERIAAAVQRIEDAQGALREMRAQLEGEE